MWVKQLKLKLNLWVSIKSTQSLRTHCEHLYLSALLRNHTTKMLAGHEVSTPLSWVFWSTNVTNNDTRNWAKHIGVTRKSQKKSEEVVCATTEPCCELVTCSYITGEVYICGKDSVQKNIPMVFPASHQQQVLSRDPDRVGESVVIFILYKLLGVSRPHFDLTSNDANSQSWHQWFVYNLLQLIQPFQPHVPQLFLTWSSVICMYRMM